MSGGDTAGAVRLVTRFRAARLDGAGPPVGVRLVWRAGYPWGIEATFHTGSKPGTEPVWVLGRDLLRAGLHGPAGHADVALCPTGDTAHVELVLCPGSGRAVLALDTTRLAAFLAATYQQVPAGEELLWAPIDDELTALLNGDPR